MSILLHFVWFDQGSNQELITLKAVITSPRWSSHGVRVMLLNANINNISAIWWRSVFSLVEETRIPGENNIPAASHWQSLSHNIVSNTPRHEWDFTSWEMDNVNVFINDITWKIFISFWGSVFVLKIWIYIYRNRSTNRISNKKNSQLQNTSIQNRVQEYNNIKNIIQSI